MLVHYEETVDNRKYVVRESGNGDKLLYPDSLVGALNGIYAKGYTKHEDNLDRHNTILMKLPSHAENTPTHQHDLLYLSQLTKK